MLKGLMNESYGSLIQETFCLPPIRERNSIKGFGLDYLISYELAKKINDVNFVDLLMKFVDLLMKFPQYANQVKKIGYEKIFVDYNVLVINQLFRCLFNDNDGYQKALTKIKEFKSYGFSIKLGDMTTHFYLLSEMPSETIREQAWNFVRFIYMKEYPKYFSKNTCIFNYVYVGICANVYLIWNTSNVKRFEDEVERNIGNSKCKKFYKIVGKSFATTKLHMNDMNEYQ
ncbi:10160_t:CDS:1, partial [Racocetra persica]